MKKIQSDRSGLSRAMVAAVIVVAIVVIIAGILVAYPSLLNGDEGGTGDWEKGYFVEWNMDYGDHYYASGQNGLRDGR